MKRNNPYLLAAALLAVAFTGCKNDEYDNKSPFDNVVYLNVSENSDTQVTTFKKTLPDLPKTFSVISDASSDKPFLFRVLDAIPTRL